MSEDDYKDYKKNWAKYQTFINEDNNPTKICSALIQAYVAISRKHGVSKSLHIVNQIEKLAKEQERNRIIEILERKADFLHEERTLLSFLRSGTIYKPAITLERLTKLILELKEDEK